MVKITYIKYAESKITKQGIKLKHGGKVDKQKR
jgi:hypothetical protein